LGWLMIQNVQPLDPGKPTMVGEAFTALSAD
jgi:hypothetical protein